MSRRPTEEKRPAKKVGLGARPDLSIRYVATASLVPYARNARTHSEEQIAQIAGSIKEFGFTNPILVGDGVVIAGHGRLEAARLLKLKRVPVITLHGLSEAKRRALVLADNRIALNAGWDLEMLRAELTDLREMGTDLKTLGFFEDELAAVLTPPTMGLTDPDEVPPPEDPVSRPGDLWRLGRHRLLCGDSTVATDVARTLGGIRPGLMVTDPPYGVDYDPAWRQRSGVGGPGLATGKVLNDDRADWREAWALFPGNVAYVWHGALHAATVAESLEASGFEIRCQIVWAKPRFVIGRGNYHWQHEPCWYAVRKGATAKWVGGRKQTTLWPIEHRKSETGHSTQKPVACMQRPIENNSSPGQAVYDPFSGSGTTIIAAEITGRVCCAIELKPAYIDVAVKRWQAFTGQQARLEGSGEAFDAAVAARTKVPA
jgi:DNA modification methylase